ncbi:MAG: lysylphosphatidylglycerol synthase transmembrane domain-containing protein, partial [Ilumatobacteraceae bacterium]
LARVVRVGDWMRVKAARWRPSLDDFRTEEELTKLRDRLRAALPGLPALVAGAVLMQLLAASILLVTLYGLGVTGELGILEFARIFFVTRVLSTLAPTPGGVGVVEAGMTAALASAGVPIAAAGAAVLVFRLGTYIVPIVSGAACWFLWRQRPTPERHLAPAVT